MNRNDFDEALKNIILMAKENNVAYVDVISGDLHRVVGGYPGSNHRMPMCCDVMYKRMRDNDRIIAKPPKGKGATLKIRYNIGLKNENNERKEYNKLVRDKIPEIIKASGRMCNVAIAKDEYKFELLEEKLKEEVNEFLEDKNLEELADIMEVLYGLAEHMGYSEEEINKKRLEKLEERGGFKCGILLLKID